MRRFTSVFGMLLAMVWLPIAMMAAEDSKSFNMAFEPKDEAQVITQTPFAGDVEMAPISEAKLIDVKPVATSVKSLAKRSKTKAVTTVADLKGDYVMVYTTLTTSVASGGLAVSVEPVEGTDSILIKNFWQKGSNVKAKVDLTAKTITIPNQVVGSNTTYGDYDIAFCLKTGKPDRTQQIEGTISEDGVISITSWWGVYVVSGDSADSFFGVYYNTSLEKANGTMSSNVYSTSSSSAVLESYPVVVSQESANIIKVKNFANHGQTVEIELKRDSTATIASQLAYLTTTSYGNFSTYAATFKEDYSGLASYAATITCNKAADKRTISWGNWTLLGTGAYYGVRLDGKVEADFDITYPSLSVTDFEGEGTEANPYLISKLDDLILLADNVNNNEDETHPLSASATAKKYSRSYEGKYFKVTNDIDMAGYRFDPIGHSLYRRFAGVVDGGNHTIKGLTVSTGTSGYAGLFGLCDTTSVLKNIKLDSPNVTSGGYYAGGLVAWTHGTIDNVHVNNATVSNTGYTGAGAIAAIANTITNCSVTNSDITAQYGYGGGVAGQINSLISNSYAIDTDVDAGGVGDTYPSGGIVGSLYGGHAENCYFTGTVDGRYKDNLRIGGIAGICYRGSIEKCFSSADLYGTGSSASVGGIVGCVYGSISNSYSTGYLRSVSSKYAAGIVGYVQAYVDVNGDSCQSVIKNCYTANVINAESYQYDAETETRETIGTIAKTAHPTIENIYFDKQLKNFGSKNYGPSYTSELTSASGPKGFDSSVWTFTEGYYPRLKGLDDTEAAKYSVTTILMPERSSLTTFKKDAVINKLGNTKVAFYANSALASEGRNLKIEGSALKLKGTIGTDTLVIYDEGIGSRFVEIVAAPIPFSGEGTEADPYLIKTKADLVTLSEITSNDGINFADDYIAIVNDIDLELDTAFVGICASSDASLYFQGHIDGRNHTIHKMKFTNCFSWTKEPTETSLGTPSTKVTVSNKGFIGRLGTRGSVKNLIIAADCELKDFWASSGAVVANNYGLIDNCKNYADVTAYSCWVGGITGQNYDGVIRNCYNAGNITTGYMNVGGIAGASYGLIENCENTGTIKAVQISNFQDTRLFSVGGISGYSNNARYVNCVNSGAVYGGYRVAGIAGTLTKATNTTGYMNEVFNCINYGAVICDDPINAGAIGGYTGTQGSSKDSYFDGQITMYKANGNTDLEGAVAATTATLTSGKALDNYSTDIWSFTAGSYPVLKQFENEDLVKVQRNIIAKLADEETVLNIKSSADLSTADGCVWTLKNGSEFKIADGKLVPPSSVKAITSDTLIATVGTVVKPIAIQTAPEVPVTGNGTADDPYLIKTPTDWNAFANFMAESSNDMADKYVKVENDLDFNAESKEIVPFSYDGVAIFNGTLDGNGKTITATHAINVKESAMVFRTLGVNSYVHDLTVAGSVTNTSFTYSGTVVGGLYGKLENVTNKASYTSSATTARNCGGLVGYAYAGSEFVNCKNTGAITSAATYIGGLVGYSAVDVKYTNCGNEGAVKYTGSTASAYVAGLIATCFPDSLIGCYNTGTITLTSASSCGYVAGLIVYATAAKDARHYYFKDCYNTADISSAFCNAGLVAVLNSSGYSKMYMEGCYNTGDISSTSTTAKSGTQTAGIACAYGTESEYRDCWNSGNIISVKPVYAAGLFGYYKGTFSAATGSKFVNCFNTGDINASGNQGGGIVAYCTNFNTVDSCFNVGEITGGFGIGGIVGCLGNATLTNSWNAADVTTSTNRAGGIVGYNTSNTAVVKNCFNVGNITSTGTVAGTGNSASTGIGGIAGQGAGHYTNVYSTGNVSGNNRVGGLIGYSYKGAVNATTGAVTGTSIENAYFCGKVAATDSCGNIVGVNMTVNGKQWNSYNTVKNVYYLDLSKNDAAVDTAGTQITVADLVKLNLGSDWNHIDEYCLPTLAGLDDNAYARLYAAAVVPADGDTYDKITKEFNVGVPEGVVWTTDNSAAVVEGNTIKFTQDYKGKLTITASIGELSRSLTLDCDAKASGVGSLSGNGKVIVNEEFYTTAGVKVAEPDTNGSAVYVVVKTYDDGTTEVVKEVR